MYESHRHKLAPWAIFIRRAYRHVIWAAVVVLCAVGVGTLGYHGIGRLPWVDAFLNASMILSGMGPVDRMETTEAKLFSAVYALFSGLVFIGVSGLLFAPWLHRVIHWVHLDDR
jgi:hypothetical protein